MALREDGRRYLTDSDSMTRMANAAICSAATQAGAICVDTYTPYNGEDGGKDPTELLADDGDHPNAAGHRVIARAMLAVGLSAWRSPVPPGPPCTVASEQVFGRPCAETRPTGRSSPCACWASIRG